MSEITATATCSQCGKNYPSEEIVWLAGAAVCAGCKPDYLRRMQEGTVPGALRYKGFWIRLAAKIIDGIVLTFLMVPIMLHIYMPFFRSVMANPGQPPNPALVAGSIGNLMWAELLGVVIVVAYNTLLLGRFGATLGKMAIGARVVTPEGQPISYGRALGRSLMEYVSIIILYIGYIMAGFDGKKRALHDRVAGTVVVAK